MLNGMSSSANLDLGRRKYTIPKIFCKLKNCLDAIQLLYDLYTRDINLLRLGYPFQMNVLAVNVDDIVRLIGLTCSDS